MRSASFAARPTTRLKFQKDGDVSEDEAHRGLDKIQKLTDDHVKKIDDLAKTKDKELMEF